MDEEEHQEEENEMSRGIDDDTLQAQVNDIQDCGNNLEQTSPNSEEIRDDRQDTIDQREEEEIESEDNALDMAASAEAIIISNTAAERNQRYNLRPNRSRDYSHRFTILPLKVAIKRWGKKAKEAMID